MKLYVIVDDIRMYVKSIEMGNDLLPTITTTYNSTDGLHFNEETSDKFFDIFEKYKSYVKFCDPEGNEINVEKVEIA